MKTLLLLTNLRICDTGSDELAQCSEQKDLEITQPGHGTARLL